MQVLGRYPRKALVIIEVDVPPERENEFHAAANQHNLFRHPDSTWPPFVPFHLPSFKTKKRFLTHVKNLDKWKLFRAMTKLPVKFYHVVPEVYDAGSTNPVEELALARLKNRNKRVELVPGKHDTIYWMQGWAHEFDHEPLPQATDSEIIGSAHPPKEGEAIPDTVDRLAVLLTEIEDVS